MKMISKSICFWIFIILLPVNYASYSVCGNWQTFRDEVCFKIIDEEKVVSFEDALKSCPQIDNSSQLLTIHSKEEQDFISEYLFKTHKLVENVWIGLKNTSKTFEWTDSSDKSYTNWKKENPIIKPDNNCVQLDSDTFQWINEPCNKKALIVCQKIPEITVSNLFKQLLEAKEEIKVMKERLIKTEERLNKSDEDFKVMKEEFRVTKERLNKSEENLFKKQNEFFNNKNVSHYHLFTDMNGKNKTFFIPLDGMRTQTFEDSVNLCKNFNSTLIEIESKEKQLMLESFLGRLGHEFLSKQFQFFWINGLRDSSGVWKWLKSNTQFTFTNWETNYPSMGSVYNNIYVETYSTDTFGKWGNIIETDPNYVICEHSFGF